MILRRCAGGIVFYANKVLIIKNDKGEWTIPPAQRLNIILNASYLTIFSHQAMQLHL